LINYCETELIISVIGKDLGATRLTNTIIIKQLQTIGNSVSGQIPSESLRILFEYFSGAHSESLYEYSKFLEMAKIEVGIFEKTIECAKFNKPPGKELRQLIRNYLDLFIKFNKIMKELTGEKDTLATENFDNM
jgi:hypothetical protein